MMLRHVLCSLSLTLVIVNAHAADKAREVSWEDLLPPSVRQIHEQAETINRELSALHGAEREAFEQVRDERDLRQRIDRGFIREADLDDKNRAMLADPPSRRHPKALAFWERVEALSGALRAERLKPNPSLSGAAVRLPGYVLPLEFEGELVRSSCWCPTLAPVFIRRRRRPIRWFSCGRKRVSRRRACSSRSGYRA
ncbi:MAG: hypothetical protein R3E83_17780 [Burkholderiaceae bacterium]